ncbi:MAG: hypothetical protein JSV18_08130 [Candidatus Bathyarchaeota archaeon]|nr:MAG: hypothetical protein JSV18_08130 [Candidatus Bathyarchaeota archaeon]
MDSLQARGPQTGPPFETALTLLQRREGARPLGTGSPELDRLTGGLEPGLFYLFYGEEGCDLPDALLMRLLVEAVRDEGARAAHLLCGNYRRSRTVMDPELLLSLIDGAGLDVDGTLSKIHIVSAFSERHLLKAPSLVEGLLEGERGFVLVAVQQLAKLFYGEDALRHEELSEFTGVVSRLRAMCSERDVILAATCRSSGRGRPVPLPEGGSFLRHSANAIVYLRESGGGLASAYAVKHPDRGRTGMAVHFNGGGEAFWAG